MTVLKLTTIAILLVGTGLFAFLFVQWLKVVEDGKRATRLPRKGDDEPR